MSVLCFRYQGIVQANLWLV